MYLILGIEININHQEQMATILLDSTLLRNTLKLLDNAFIPVFSFSNFFPKISFHYLPHQFNLRHNMANTIFKKLIFDNSGFVGSFHSDIFAVYPKRWRSFSLEKGNCFE